MRKDRDMPCLKRGTRMDIVNHIHDKDCISKTLAKEVIDTTIESLRELCKTHDTIMICGFGVFRILSKKERIGLNPRKPHEKHVISARKIISFKPSDLVRSFLTQNACNTWIGNNNSRSHAVSLEQDRPLALYTQGLK